MIPNPKKAVISDVRCHLPLTIDDTCFRAAAHTFASYVENDFALSLSFEKGGIRFVSAPALDTEEYRLSCGAHGVCITASTEKGAHLACAALLSLLTAEDGVVTVPVAEIEDKPDCSYRGLMVDLARQWHPFPYLLKYIDLCYRHRASHLQLHFTDDQSFTLPLHSYPELSTEGRTYTMEEIRALNTYAASRGITLVPEVDLPGHTRQFFLKYPALFGEGPVLPADDAVFAALHRIFREVEDMFPASPYIHIGGDEAAIQGWETCSRTQAYMAAHHIENIHEMYAEYIRMVTEMLLSDSRTPIVWEGFAKEYDDRISRDVIVIGWESYYQPAYDLAEAGFTLINCSWKPLYIVTPDTHWAPEEILAWDPWSWQHWWEQSKAYPNGYSIPRDKPVLGGQICAWGDRLANMTDTIPGIEEELSLIAERLPALCERTWNCR